MSREEFLSELRRRLSGLPQEDIDERIDFYAEMIDDRIEDGMIEEDAVQSIGTVDSVVEQIMSETHLTKLVRERVRPKRQIKIWEIVLLVLGSPVWVPLVISAVIVMLSIYLVIWAVVLCVYAADVSMAAGVIFGVISAGVFLNSGNIEGVPFSVGTGLVCAGLAVLLFFLSIAVTKGVIRLSGRILLWIKSLFIGKEKTS